MISVTTASEGNEISAASPTPPSRLSTALDEDLQLSPALRSDLLDFTAWGEILTTYGRTMRVAVALTDCQGSLLGKCHNAQPVWTMVRDAASNWSSGCSFCIIPRVPCTAVAEALKTGETVMVRDQAGLTHVAVPLILGNQHLGAIIAGQVFDRYPDSLVLRRVSRSTGVEPQQLWNVARKQRPVSGAILQGSGDLLLALGHAFLQQRYGAILKAKLAETNEHFRILVEGATQHALFTMDSTGLVSSWNRGAERMLGYNEEIVGQNFSRIFTPDDIQNSLPGKQLSEALESGRAEDDGWRIGKNQKRFWAHVSIASLLHHESGAGDLAVIIQDATEQRQITNLLEESRQARARLQDKFLSHVSHELRTPLTAIYFFTTNVLDGLLGDLTPEQHEHLSMALDNITQLKNMVSDLLDITRTDTHKLTVEPRHASAEELIAEVLNTCRGNAATKGVTLKSELASGLPFIWADPSRVRQILTNLIDNAIKFTASKGTVTVQSCLYPDDSNFLLISVSDSGCGISPENCQIVFDRLAQVKGGTEESRSGLGLGLFISRELVSLHGGKIWVESAVERGSTFFFTLPLFSLAKLCAPIFTGQSLDSLWVTLIAVDLTVKRPAAQPTSMSDIRKILERCIHSDKDVLLPPMSDADPVESFFIVASTDALGFSIIAKRISAHLQNLNALDCVPVISSKSLFVAPNNSRDEKVREVASQVESLVSAHLAGKEKLYEWEDNSDR